MKIRKLQKKDIAEIIRIGRRVQEFDVSKIAVFWNKNQLEKLAKSRNDVCIIVEDKGKVIGFAITTSNRATGKVTLENSWVHPDLRDKNIGTSLAKELLQRLKAKGYSYIMGFTLLPESKLGFLKRNGFLVGKRGTWIDRDF